MKQYIFDVDNTLTPSRQRITDSFYDFFLDFCTNNSVSLVSGSDYEKIEEQLGSEICSKVLYIFACSGNAVYSNKKIISTNSLHIPTDMLLWFDDKLKASSFVLRTGNHVEERIGNLNFSIVGRNATLGERQLYKKWDETTKERETLVTEFNELFPRYEATIGGETGIDIYNKGQDKSQILKWFNTTDYLKFFGDAIYPGGNDYTLAKAIKNGLYVSVNNWKDTFETLQHLSEVKI